MQKYFRGLAVFIRDLLNFLQEINIPIIKTLALVLTIQIPILIAILVVAFLGEKKDAVLLGFIFIVGGVIIISVFERGKKVTSTVRGKFNESFIHPKKNHYYLAEIADPENTEKSVHLIKMLRQKRYWILTNNLKGLDQQWTGREVLVREIKEKEEIESIKALNELL